ncbi:MAG: efflux RND transporter permease subunit [Verrucomicrobiales bacterium]|nr:efflux RND transporter permease subunit [Verrucomicrobiales bacterium]
MSQSSSQSTPVPGIAGRVAAMFLDSKLTPLVVLASVLLGLAAVVLLPREEEPQIKVPMIDVMVAMPGASAQEVEERATRPMEKLLWEIPGVEYVYSTSRTEESLVIVRFKVGQDPELSLARLSEKLRSNFDRIPPGVSFPLIKPKSIDDVPILALTFHSSRYDHLTLGRLAAQVDDAVKQVPLVAETMLIGGVRRQLRVILDPLRLAARQLSLTDLAPILRQANRQSRSGELISGDRTILIETGGFLRSAAEVASVVVGVSGGRPVYLRDVASIQDGAEEPASYVFFGRGREEDRPAVTLSVAKRPGVNAIEVADAVLRKVDQLKGVIIPADVEVSITRHYGETAAEKSNELLFHMAIAVVSVSLLILFTLGWRESIVVAVAIPSTLALTLLVFYLQGFTLNRITLFALIFSIGILVDDAIVVVENLVRHFRLPENHSRDRFVVAAEAVGEVGNPTILATFAVIAAVLPMAFVGGLMGPYMRPIPVGASAAMFWSLLIAFVVTPWAAVRLLKLRGHGQTAVDTGEEARPPTSAEAHPEDGFTRFYRRVMVPLLMKRGWRYGFLGVISLLLLGAMAMVPLGWVKVKMLPFDNKSEFQIILNMPEGSVLERTAQAAREIAAVVRQEPEVLDCQVYAGTASPFNFNGLVRHYFMRRGPNVADVQVNLVSKHRRSAQSHEVAKRVRLRIADVVRRYGARVAVAEVPPGPPVLQTLVAEIYGPSEKVREALAAKVRDLFARTEGVVDVDWYREADQARVRFVVDREKAAMHGISAEQVAQALKIAAGTEVVDLLHDPVEKRDVSLVLELPRSARQTPEDLLGLRLRAQRSSGSSEGPLVPLRELVRLEHGVAEKSIYHKNLMPVTYVIGDVAGAVESPVYAIFQMNEALRQWDMREMGGQVKDLVLLNAAQPFTDGLPTLKWDGEWHITLEVFHDLGLAFAAVLVLIYVLMVGWFKSFITPLIVMVAIPFSLVGILPAHAAMGAFFTATSMIGFMAGAGIVVRNSIILVDFIELRLSHGLSLADAVVDAGAVRFRPMLLTAMAVVVGAAVILADPIFQGLAIALMAGEIASLLISRMAVPIFYYWVHARTFSPRSQDASRGA